jgi:uncharacterized membrane protein
MDALIAYRDRAERFIRRRVAWNRLFHAVSYARSALWVVPLLAIVAVLVFAPVLRWIDSWLGWRMAGLGISGAAALYETVITLSLSFLVFTFGSLLVAIQVASGQLTPRIIATTLLRDNVVRASVGLFVFTLVFSVMALNRLETRVLEITAFVTSVLGIACMVMFLFLIDYAARMLRPVSILTRVGNEGMRVIATLYPVRAAAGHPRAARAGARRPARRDTGDRAGHRLRRAHSGGAPGRRYDRMRSSRGRFRRGGRTHPPALWRRRRHSGPDAA